MRVTSPPSFGHLVPLDEVSRAADGSDADSVLRIDTVAQSLRFLAAIALALALASCEAANPTANDKNPKALVVDRPVLVEAVHFEDFTRTRTFAATIKPRVESDLGFRVGGKVAKRLVQNGDRVRVGQALLVLDTNDLELQVQQAAAELKAAQTSLIQAEADEGRAADLQRKGWTAATTLEKSHAAAEEARGRLTRARRALDLATNACDYATLEADADGVITATPVEPGQVVAAGQTVTRLAHLADVEAAVALPETFVGRAQAAVPSLTLWSLPDRAYQVRLRELSPAADPATRTYAARYTIPDADDAVRLGMSATLTLREEPGVWAARLPMTSLFDHGRGPCVWVLDTAGKLTPRAVEIARYDRRGVLIGGGLAEGERVVVLGVQKLDPSLTVRAVSSLSF